MNLSLRDALTTVLAILGGIVVFAKIQSFNWSIISTWKSALLVLGIIGLLMLALNAVELLDADNWVNWGEAVLWIAAAVLIVVGFFVAAPAMFYIAAAVLAVTWIAMLARHSWHSTHTYMASQ